MTESVAKAGPFTAIVLAGQRAEGDPLAQRGMAWKALVPVGTADGGRLLALLSSGSIGRIAVGTDPRPAAQHRLLQDALARQRSLCSDRGRAATAAAAWKGWVACPTL